MSSTIGNLPSGTPAVGTDEAVIERSLSNFKLTLSQIVSLALASVYPVDSLYTSFNSTNPNTVLGFGTWNAIAGRFLVGVDGADPSWNTAAQTGGAKTSVSTGNVAAPTFNGTAAVSTDVGAGTPAGTVSTPTLTMNSYTPTGNSSIPVFTGAALALHNHSVTATGTCSIPVFTGSAVASANANAITPTGNCSIPVFTGAALAAHSHELPMQIISATLSRMLNNAVFGTGTSRTSAGNITTAANAVSSAVALSGPNNATMTPAGTINAPAFTGTALPLHNHSVTATGTINAAAFTGSAVASANANALTPAGTINAAAFTGTANTLTGTISTPTFTGNALAAHNHNVVATGTVSAPAYTGDAQSILPPYMALYLWRRTA